MYFALEWDSKPPTGYVITLTQIWPEDGLYKSKPLRKFKEQGHAMIFKEHDCPKLTKLQIRALVKNYDPNKLYRRIDEHHFRVSDTNY